jgi:cell wall-associated NlpC family hydrolase
LPRHIRNFFLIALISSLSLTAVTAQSAAGDPIGDKQAQAKALQDQIEANYQQISGLGEQYNGAVLALEEAEASIVTVQAEIDATQAEIDRIQGLVENRAASVYRRALGNRSLDLSYGDAEELIKRQHYADAAAKRDDRLLNQLDDAKGTLADQRTAAEKARADADAERQRIESTKASLETANAEQQQLLTQVQGEIATLVAEELARRLREAEAMARNKLIGGDGDPNLPPPGPAAAQAVEWGKTQLGKRYLYAATGPDRYDCSGFTMVAFRNAGVSLPHYSGAQYAKLPHVPLTHIMPGDLMFWGSGGSTHVAIYVGEGRILEAGGSGNDVHIGPIWGHPSGAARVLD